MAAKISRNAPCPCGSGRKFKHCCLAKADSIEQSRVRVRRAEGRVVDALFAFALKRFGKPFFEHAWLDFWAGEPPDADEFTDIPEFDSMFVPWFVTGFIRDPHGEGIEPDWPDEPVGLYWLRTEQPLIDALERAWVTAACASPMSIFVVEGVEQGLSLDIRDLFTGRRFHVLEQSASRTVHRTDLLFVRVVTTGGVCLMFGMAPLAVPARLHLSILDWRDRVFRRRTPTRHDLMDCDAEIRDLYLELAPEIRNPVMPQLRNTDGDPLEPTTACRGPVGELRRESRRCAPGPARRVVRAAAHAGIESAGDAGMIAKRREICKILTAEGFAEIRRRGRRDSYQGGVVLARTRTALSRRSATTTNGGETSTPRPFRASRIANVNVAAIWPGRT